MSSGIFREEALEEIQSPEELDQLMQVTGIKGWVALFSLGLLVVLGVIWGFYGTIPTKVKGRGMMIKSGGVKDIIASGGGEITDIQVQVGDRVEQGEVVARVAQPDLKQKLESARERLKSLKNEKKKVDSFNTTELKLRLQEIKQKKKTYRQKINTLKKRKKFLLDQIDSREKLLSQGLITEQKLFKTKQEHEKVIEKINSTKTKLNRTDSEKMKLRRKQEQQALDLKQKINKVKRKIANLEDKFSDTTRITSDRSGKVLAIDSSPGDIIQAGESILTLELIGKSVMDVQTVFYVPASEGKKIQPGMDVKISPSTVKTQKYGYLVGKVTRVSKFPVSRKQMLRVLGNENLVRQLSGKSSPIQVYAYLAPDPSTKSGYQWTSRGPDIEITPGTIATASVVVKEEPPVNLVIPMIKKYLGIY